MNQTYLLGDIVLFENKIMQVREYKDNNYYNLYCLSEEIIYCYVEENRIKPIKISPTLLELNGWKKIDINGWRELCTQNISLYIIQDLEDKEKWLIYASKGKYFLCSVKTISDLQHFYFGLGLNIPINEYSLVNSK